MRLVVNSHVKYSKPLGDLFQSLLQVHFQEPKPHFQEIVVVFGGSSRDIGPYTAPGKWGELGVTYINSTLNAFDYNALSSLYHYRDHPRVRAHAYLYTHDTVLMTDDFMERFDKLASIIQEDELRIPITPSSNIFALGRKVIESYGTNFDVNLTKGEAVDLEWGRGPVMNKVKHIRNFAKKLTQLPGRVSKGTDDPYHTKVKRHKYWYPDFGINKFILMHFYGDIGGDGAPLKPNYR